MPERLKAAVTAIISAWSAWARPGVGGAMRMNPALAPAWSAWQSGAFVEAGALGKRLVAQPETCDAGRHILSLVAHVTGDHGAAVAHHDRIRPGYRWLPQLDEPVLWSHVHGGDLQAALVFARARKMPEAALKRLELAINRPLSVELDGVVELPFTDDPLSPLMPGVAASLCGRPTVARLDTGGAFVHLSAQQAKAFGVRTVACEKAFASLTTGRICFGAADQLVLGGAILRNIPVAVHHGALSTQGIADNLGVEVGPIIGTNVLQQFLATIDGPGQRLILSRRGNEAARTQHLALVSHARGSSHDVPFAMLHDHFMIVRGSVATHPALLFVDSGLVAFNTQQGQAALLAPHSGLAVWGAPRTSPELFPVIPGTVALDGVARVQMSVFPVSDRVWRQFGDWGGLKVNGLLSWGFLSHFSWTIDFDRYTYSFGDETKGVS